jgi:hypothetical protein
MCFMNKLKPFLGSIGILFKEDYPWKKASLYPTRGIDIRKNPIMEH